MVEFVIVLPFLILVIFGIIDFGRVFFNAIMVTNATREGARYGTFHPSDPAGMIAATQREAQSAGLNIPAGNISITCPDPTPLPVSGCPSGSSLRVTAFLDFDLVMEWLLPSPIRVTRFTEMVVP